MTADDVRAMYDEPPGTKIPRFPLFTRGCVGMLLGEIDRLRAYSNEVACLNAGMGAEIDRLKASLTAVYDRVAAQGELLSKRAENGKRL